MNVRPSAAASAVLLCASLLAAAPPAHADERAAHSRAHLDRIDMAAARDSGQREVRPFRLVAVSWPADQAGSDVLVRVRRDGRWTEWVDLHHELDGADAAEGNERLGTAPLWVGAGVDGVQARFEGAVPADAEIVLVEPGDGGPGAAARTTIAGTTASARVFATPGDIVSRAGWGANEGLRTQHPDPSCRTPRYGDTIRAGFVHHTVTSNAYTADESDDIVRGIYAYHVNGNGWCDIGYNFLVDKFGTVFEGRYGGVDLPVVGAQVADFNTNTFGASVLGQFEPTHPDPPAATPTPETLESLAQLFAWKLSRNYRDPKAKVVLNGRVLDVVSGHRDAGSTACPGENLYAKLPALRDRVDTLIAPYASPIYQRWVAMSGWPGEPFEGERAARGGVVATFSGSPSDPHDWVDLWSSQFGTFALYGPIRTRHYYLPDLGLPLTDVLPGRTGSTFAAFQGGRIHWSGATGAQAVRAPFLGPYDALGGFWSRLGLPTSEHYFGARPGSVVQHFQGGRMYWSAASGTQPVWGRILTRYLRLGGPASRLRLPMTGEYAVRGGRKQKFQGGYLLWKRSTNRVIVRYY